MNHDGSVEGNQFRFWPSARWGDPAGALGFRIAEAVRAEIAFNANGAGRKIENRQKDGGKRVTHPPISSRNSAVGTIAGDRPAGCRETAAGTASRIILLADALHRAFESASTVGSSMVIVDALDETAAGFHAAHGFVRLPDQPRMVLPKRPQPASVSTALISAR